MNRIRPYVRLARLDKPWGALLLAWPTLGALALSSFRIQDSPWLIFIFGIILTRSAGCVVNDYADMWIDGHVERTRSRPLVSGIVTLRQAKLFCFGLFLSAATLLLWLPISVFYMAIVSLILIIAYPFTKRYLRAPQLFLGFVFSQGIPMAYLANHHAFDRIMVCFYLLSLVWVVIYDTIYAMTDAPDDIKMNAGSLAVLLGSNGPMMATYAYGCLGIGWLLWGVLANMSTIYYVGLVYVYYNLYQQTQLVHAKQYFQAFLLNQHAGICIGLGIIGSCI